MTLLVARRPCNLRGTPPRPCGAAVGRRMTPPGRGASASSTSRFASSTLDGSTTPQLGPCLCRTGVRLPPLIGTRPGRKNDPRRARSDPVSASTETV